MHMYFPFTEQQRYDLSGSLIISFKSLFFEPFSSSETRSYLSCIELGFYHLTEEFLCTFFVYQKNNLQNEPENKLP